MQWFSLPVVTVDTFIKLQFTGAGAITLYEFNAAAADTAFTQAQEAEFNSAVGIMDIPPAAIQYVTARANKVYFLKVSGTEAAAGTLSATKIMEEDMAMLENLYGSGVMDISNATVQKTYSFTDIIKVKDPNGNEIIVSHSKNDWDVNMSRTENLVTWRGSKYNYTKIYSFQDGEDTHILTFAIVDKVTDITESKYNSLMWVIDTVLGGFGFNINAAEDYHVLAFTTSGGNTRIPGYYGFEEVVVIPKNITSVGGFGSNTLIREVILQGSAEAAISITANAFQNCRNLELLVLPASVTSIGSNAFSNCNSLKFVYYEGIYPLPGSIVINDLGNTALTDNIIYEVAVGVLLGVCNLVFRQSDPIVLFRFMVQETFVKRVPVPVRVSVSVIVLCQAVRQDNLFNPPVMPVIQRVSNLVLF